MSTKSLAALGATMVLASCTGDDPTTPAPPGATVSPEAGLEIVASSLAISPIESAPVIIGGATLSLPVTLIRTVVDGPVTVTLTGLPAGVTASAIVIAAGATTGTIPIVAATGTAQNDAVNATVTATAADVPDATAGVKLVVRGKPGELDTTFGAGGTRSGLFDPINSNVQDVVLYGADHIGVFAESPPMKARVGLLLANGQTEAPPFEVQLDHGFAMGVQLDGAVLVAGGVGAVTSIQRYSPAGVKDTNFGNLGAITLPSGTTVNGFVNLADAFVTVSGASVGGLRPGTFSKYTLAGAAYGGFGTNGAVAFSAVGTNYPFSIGVAKSGKLFSFFAGTPGGYGFGQVTPDGKLDTTFGGNGTGYTAAPTGNAIGGNHGVSDADGNLYGAIYLDDGTNRSWLLAKFKPDGTLDTSFGNAGAKGPFTNGISAGVVIDRAGNLVVGVQVAAEKAINLVRFTRTGALDTTFGKGGTATIAFPAATGVSNVRLVSQSDDRIVGVTNVYGTNGRNDSTLFRFWP